MIRGKCKGPLWPTADGWEGGWRWAVRTGAVRGLGPLVIPSWKTRQLYRVVVGKRSHHDSRKRNLYVRKGEKSFCYASLLDSYKALHHLDYFTFKRQGHTWDNPEEWHWWKDRVSDGKEVPWEKVNESGPFNPTRRGHVLKCHCFPSDDRFGAGGCWVYVFWVYGDQAKTNVDEIRTINKSSNGFPFPTDQGKVPS